MNKHDSSTKEFTDFPYITEQLKVSKHSVSARVNVLTGQENDIWVCYSSSLNTSGYGDSKKKAQASFIHNVEIFCEHILKLKVDQQKKILKDLGWERKPYAKKQFSKVYVDENGELQNLKHAKLQALETIAA